MYTLKMHFYLTEQPYIDLISLFGSGVFFSKSHSYFSEEFWITHQWKYTLQPVRALLAALRLRPAAIWFFQNLSGYRDTLVPVKGMRIQSGQRFGFVGSSAVFSD